jgi:TetR/AcrR family transcriptional regulator, cholesterol catabolism regulator
VAVDPPKRRDRQILEAAAHIFHERGYADTSVQDVANAVGLLKGSLYYYIESKEDLLFRVLQDVHAQAKQILDVVPEMDVPPLERLAAYVRGHVEFNLRNIEKVAVYYHDFEQLSPERREEIVTTRKRYEEFVIELIEEAQKAGDVDPDLDAHVATYSVLGMLNWVYTWYRPGGKVSISDFADLVAEIVVGGLRSVNRT